jgi:hypothetical protein
MFVIANLQTILHAQLFVIIFTITFHLPNFSSPLLTAVTLYDIERVLDKTCIFLQDPFPRIILGLFLKFRLCRSHLTSSHLQTCYVIGLQLRNAIR